MSKLELPRLVGGYLDVTLINSWADKIEAFSNTTFSLDGAEPNNLTADFDLNGHTLLNSGASSDDPNAVLTRKDIEALVQSYASGYVIQRIEKQIATASQTIVNLTQLSYQPGANNLAVYINGVRVFGFQETSTTSFVLASPLTVGQVIQAVTNDYVATVSLPAHKHAWGDLLNIPATASRWPDYSELTGVPLTFTPTSHTHPASAITSGRLADAQRGVYVQASAPSLGAGDAGALWFW